MFIYFEREGMCRCMSREGAEREGERIPSRFPAVSLELDLGLEPTNCEIMT